MAERERNKGRKVGTYYHIILPLQHCYPVIIILHELYIHGITVFLDSFNVIYVIFFIYFALVAACRCGIHVPEQSNIDHFWYLFFVVSCCMS